MIRSLLLALLLTFSAFASPPEALVGGTVPAAAARQRYSPSVASDGEDFFAVWSDQRAGESMVIGTRITRDGRVLDPLGLRIATAKIGVHNPSVAWDGAAYLVAWTGADDAGELSIRAARVAPDGSIVTQPRVIAARGYTESSHAVASNGTVSVIVYRGSAASAQVWASVLDRDGNTLRHEMLPSTGLLNSPVVAAGTSRFVVAWTQWGPNGGGPGAVRAIPLTETGFADGTATTIAAGGEAPSVGSDGTRFTITWMDHDGRDDVLASRTFDENLAPVGEEHFLLGDVHSASVLWAADHYEIVTMRSEGPGRFEIVSITLDRDGEPLSQPRSRGDVSSDAASQGVVAGTNGADVLAVRAVQGPPDNRTHTMFSHLYPGNADTSDAPVLLSWSGNAHRNPSIASGPSGHIAAWAEQDGVFATRIDRNGHSLDGRGIRLSGFHDSFVRTAFDGTNYVVAWRDRADFFEVVVRWIAPLTGATVAERHLAVFDFPELALAASPEATYVVFTEGYFVRAVRIPHATYTPDVYALDVSTVHMMAAHPAAAWNGSELLVTWTELYGAPNISPPVYIPFQVHAARVTANLSLLDPEPLLVVPAPDIFHPMGLPSVASDGADWLVVTDSSGGDILARRVLRSGVLEGDAPVKIGEGTEPAVAWSNPRYAVTWKEGGIYDHARPLVLAAVPRSGALVASNRALVSSGAADSRPSVVAAGSNEVAVAYTKFSHLPQHTGAERTFFRLMDLSPRGRVVRR